MTLAAAFACSDGIVIAADTKESYGDGDHTYVNKIEVVKKFTSAPSLRPSAEAAHAAIAGSGYAYLVDHITSHIKELFIANVDSSVAKFSHGLSELMARLYGSDAFAAYPRSEPTDMYTQFLVAVRLNRDENPALFIVNSSLVSQVGIGAYIIGCGPMEEMASELGQMHLEMEESTVAALYLIHEAKRRYSPVGGVTHIFAIPNLSPYYVRPWREREWDQGQKEVLFDFLRQWHHRILVTVGSKTISNDHYKAVIKEYVSSLRRIRGEFDSIEKRYQDRIPRNVFWAKLARVRKNLQKIESAATASSPPTEGDEK